MAIKIGQINLGRSRAAMAEIEKIIKEEKLDIILIQEPYWRPNIKISLGNMIGVIEEEEVWACNFVINKDIDATLIREFSTNKFVVMKIESGGEEIVIINGYFKYGDGIELYLNKLELVVRKYRGKKVFVAVDANAKSPVWFSGCTDERGELFEETIATLELEVLNVESDVTTFENLRGIGTNIDVTLVSKQLKRNVEYWSIKEELFSSDHRLIMVGLINSSNLTVEDNSMGSGVFNIRNANWNMFDWSIVEGVDNMGELNLTLDEEVTMIERVILDACYASIPLAKRGDKKVMWWTEDLTKQRREKSRLERRWKECKKRLGGDHELTMIARNEYTRKRNAYVNNIKQEKKRSWEKLLTQFESDPWGKIYKIIYGKSKSEIIINSLNVNGRVIDDRTEIVNTLLNGLLPDDMNINNEEHTQIIEESRLVGGNRLNDTFVMEELKRCVFELKNGKAPGVDGI